MFTSNLKTGPLPPPYCLKVFKPLLLWGLLVSRGCLTVLIAFQPQDLEVNAPHSSFVSVLSSAAAYVLRCGLGIFLMG